MYGTRTIQIHEQRKANRESEQSNRTEELHAGKHTDQCYHGMETDLSAYNLRFNDVSHHRDNQIQDNQFGAQRSFPELQR